MYETTGDSNLSMSTWPRAPEAFRKSCQYCQLNLKWKLQPCTLPQMGFPITQAASSLYFLNPHVDPCKPSHFHLLLDSHFLYLNLQQIVESLWGKTCAYSPRSLAPFLSPCLLSIFFFHLFGFTPCIKSTFGLRHRFCFLNILTGSRWGSVRMCKCVNLRQFRFDNMHRCLFFVAIFVFRSSEKCFLPVNWVEDMRFLH